MSASPKDLDTIVEVLLRNGWRIEPGRHRHLKLIPPWGGEKKLIAAKTTVSNCGMLNFRAFVRRFYRAEGRKSPV